jgi:hypothetical protein
MSLPWLIVVGLLLIGKAAIVVAYVRAEWSARH